MNKLDKEYTDLLQDILDNGVKKETRNGSTLSIFGRQIRHNMKDGFPLLTTKKMPFKTIATELLWFISGSTNIKYLVDNNCHIWDGDAYKRFYNETQKGLDSMFLKNEGPNKIVPFTQEEFINKIKTDDEFAKKWGELGKIYGAQWRDWGGKDDSYVIPSTYNLDFTLQRPVELVERWRKGIDQIQNLINDLKTTPDSRRLLVSAWNPSDLPNMVLPPCHYGFQVYTRELSESERHAHLKTYKGLLCYDGIGNVMEYYDSINIPKRAISLMWSQRSCDTFLGIPFNIASYGLLLEIIAKAVNMVPDELIGNLGDVHLYSNHIEQAKEQIGREPFPLPKLNINTEFWPTEGGSCGEGPIDALAVFNGFFNDDFCKCLLEEDIQLSNYQSHPTIKAPLSN